MQENIRTDVKSIGTVSAFLHPLVIMNIFEHWTKLNHQQDCKPQPVFGALIGKKKGINIEIINSCELKYTTEKDENVTIDKEFYLHKEDQFKQLFPDLDFLGWYTTGDQQDIKDINVHKQIVQLNESPILLKLNPFEMLYEMPLKVFKSVIDKEKIKLNRISCKLIVISLETILERNERISESNDEEVNSLEIKKDSVVSENMKSNGNKEETIEQWLIDASNESNQVDSLEYFRHSSTGTIKSPSKKKYEHSLSTILPKTLFSLIEFDSTVNQLLKESTSAEEMIRYDTEINSEIKSDLNLVLNICFESNEFPSSFSNETLVGNFVFVCLSYIIYHFKNQYNKNVTLFSQKEVVQLKKAYGGFFDYCIVNGSSYNLDDVVLFVECKLSDVKEGIFQCMGYLRISYEFSSDKTRPFFALSISGEDFHLIKYHDKKFSVYCKELFLSSNLLDKKIQFTKRPLIVDLVYFIIASYFKIDLNKKNELKRKRK